MNTDDVLLLKQIVDHSDEKAFDQLFVKYYPGLLRFSKMLLPYPTDEAEDIITEVFLTIWQQRAKLIFHHSFTSYLYMSVKNRIKDYYRKNNIHSYDSLDSLVNNACPEYIPDQQLSFKELNSEMDRLIASLPARTQLVFKMNRHDNITYNDIALILNLSVNSVKTHMYRALKFLKEGYRASNTSQ